MHPLRPQLAYSLLWLFSLALLVGLLVALQSPGKVTALSRIEYFEGAGPDTFPVRQLSSRFFFWWRLGLAGAGLVFTFISLGFFRPQLITIPGKLLAAFRQLRTGLQQEIQSLTLAEKVVAGLTIAGLVLQRCLYVFKYPIHTDEAASYFLFIRQGIFATFSFYPIPNNHLLQNLLAVPLDQLGLDAFWVLRFWPLLLGLLLSFTAFFLIRKFSDFITAYLAVALFSFTSLTLFISTQGRGYTLLTLLAVLAFGAVLQAFRTGQKRYWFLFSLLCTLGFFTVPTFLYPFAALVVFSAIMVAFPQHRSHFLPFLLAGFTIGLGVLLLYLPLLLVSGPEALLGNKYLQALTPEQFAEKLPVFLTETQGQLLGDRFGPGLTVYYLSVRGLLLLFLLQKLLFVKSKLPRHSLWLIGFVLMLNLVFYVLLRYQLVLPPPRVVFFKSIFDMLGLALVLAFFIRIMLRWPALRAAALLAGIAVFAYLQVQAANFFLTDYPRPYYTYPPLNQQIRESGATKVYVEEPFYRLFLQYDYARYRQPLQLDAADLHRTSRYDYIVLYKENPFPPGISDRLYQLVYEDELVKAFRPKPETVK